MQHSINLSRWVVVRGLTAGVDSMRRQSRCSTASTRQRCILWVEIAILLHLSWFRDTKIMFQIMPAVQ
jgi:hypothetical protein